MKRSGNPSAQALANLLHHRWSVPVIALLHARGGGAKFVTLQKILGTARDSLARTLTALIESGIVARNPGYGHPMRPEYLLSPAGARLGPLCLRLMEWLDRYGLQEVGLKKWSLPVVHAISCTDGRFNRIRSALPDATPRALAASLRDLQNAGLVNRFLVDADPPRTEYALTRRGKLLVPILSGLEGAP